LLPFFSLFQSAMPQNPASAPSPENFPATLSRWLLAVGLGALLLRFWLAVRFPVSGVEALF
jgi:hypothetical protein